MAEQLLHRGRIELVDALEFLGMDAAGQEQTVDAKAVRAGQVGVEAGQSPIASTRSSGTAWPRCWAASVTARS